MPLNDSQLVGLLQLLLVQQKEIALLKAGTIALLKIAQDEGLKDVESRFQRYSTDLVNDMIPESSLATMHAIEQTICQLLPIPDANN